MSAIVKIITGIVLIVAGIVLAPFTGGLSLQLVAIGASLALQGIIQVLSKKPSTKPDVSKVNVRIAEPIRWLFSGVNRAGGAVLFAEFDSAGNLWYLVVHGDSILTSIDQIYLDDLPVTLDGSGNVTTNDFCLTTKKDAYTGTGTKVTYVQIWTTTYSESDPTPPAISALEAAFPSKWTSDHKLVGTTYSVIKMNALDQQNRYKIYKWRGPLGLGEPAIGIVGQWSNVFDPRDNTQTNGTPTTYKPTRNSVLAWAWFRTHRYGRNKDRSSINWDKVAEQADIADEIVTGLVGTHVRYQCDIAIPDDKQRVEAEQEILMTADAQLVFDDDGKCWPRVGYYYAPTLALSRNRDIVAMESIEAQDGESETQGVIVRFTDPTAKYAAQPSAPWYNPLYYVDGQSNNFLTVDILACQDHNQAMRLAKAIGMRSQPLHKVAPTVGLRGLKMRQERIINLNYDNTFAGDYEVTSPVQIDPVGIFCAVSLVPVDADRWNLLPGEEKPKPVVDNADTVLLPTNATGVALSIDGGRIKATFDAPGRNDVGYEFQYIVTSDIGSKPWLDMSVQMLDLIAYSGGVSQGVQYSVQYRAVAGSGAITDWSTPPLTITPGLIIDPSTLLTGSGSAGSAAISWRNPSNAAFGYTNTYRNTTNNFGTATLIVGPITGGLGQIQGFNDTGLTAGTYYYWNRAFATDNTPASVTGPITVTVT